MLHQIYKDKAITLLTAEGTTIEQLEKMADNLIDFLQYHTKKKNWTGKIILCGSEHKSSFAIKTTEMTGGRTKKVFFEPKRIKCKVNPHIHMILLDAFPNTAITDKLKEYWYKRNGNGTTHFTNIVEEKGGKNGFKEYMKLQDTFWRESIL